MVRPVAVSEIDKSQPPGSRGISRLWRDERFRGIILQCLTIAIVGGVLFWLIDNTLTNMSNRKMSAGFDFLDVSAGFGIGFTLIPYQEGDSYLRVFWVGIANTLLVAAVSIIIATVLGLIVGLARLSSNWVISRIARAYVEFLRNTPLLLQIIAWYFGVFNLLPKPKQSIELAEGFVLNNRGFYMPAPVPEPGFTAVGISIAIAIAAAVGLSYWSTARLNRTGKTFPGLSLGLLVVVVLPLAVFTLLGTPLAWDVPVLKGFNYRGGIEVPPSFCALIVALSVYTSCFIAEIVRAGIQSVPRGQLEAAGALNLSPGWTMRRIVLPQAMRVIIPPLISNYLNITKNSSLAIAIGFPDLVSVWMNTSLNQSGRAIPIVAMTMAFYCLVSLSVSLVMNWYNNRVQLKER